MAKGKNIKESDTDIFGEHLVNLNARQIVFLSALVKSTSGIKTKIFTSVDITRTTFYRWKKENPSFATCYEIADAIVQDARLEWCMGQLYQMAEKGVDVLIKGEIEENVPIPAMVKVEIIKTIMKTTRAGKLALSPNIPEQHEEKPKTKSLDDILEGFVLQQPHSKGIEAFDQKEAKKDEGQ